MNRQILTLTITAAILLAACESRSVRAQRAITPELQHLVMQGKTLETPGGNIVRLMLLGLNTTENHTDIHIAWHLLKVRSRIIRFTFNRENGFILKTGGNSYKSIRVPQTLAPALNRAGSVRIRFAAISNIASVMSFDLTEKGAPAGTGWSFTNCRIVRGRQ